MTTAEIHSLLSLSCYRIVSGQCEKGLLECQESQVRFQQRDQIYSIPFHKIENIELRSVHREPNIIFLTHVGLIIFYFYEETPRPHIEYIFHAIHGALNIHMEERPSPPIWTASILISPSWSMKKVLVTVHKHQISISNSDFDVQYPMERNPLPITPSREQRLVLPFLQKDITLIGNKVPTVRLYLRAIQDGGILGSWFGTKTLFFSSDILLVLSSKNLYFLSRSWFHSAKLQIIPIHHIVKISFTSQHISFLTRAAESFIFSPKQTPIHTIKRICSLISEQSSQEEQRVFLWRKNEILSATLQHSTSHLILETAAETLSWSWETLCRDDDEDSNSSVISLRHGVDSLRIQSPHGVSFVQQFYQETNLPYRRLHWKELSELARQRIFHNHTAHICTPDAKQHLIGRIVLFEDELLLQPLSISQASNFSTVHVFLNTTSGRYFFRSRIISTRERLFLSPPTVITLTSQRIFPRYSIRKKAAFAPLLLDQKTKRWKTKSTIFSCILYNISEGGASILSPNNLKVGEKILIDIEEYPQQIICLVKHNHPHSSTQHQIGLEFCSISHQTRQNIKEMLEILVKEQH